MLSCFSGIVLVMRVKLGVYRCYASVVFSILHYLFAVENPGRFDCGV